MKRIISLMAAFLTMLFLIPLSTLNAAGGSITVTTNDQLLAALSNPAYTNITSQGITANLNFTVNPGVTLTLNIDYSPNLKNGTLINNGNLIINVGTYYDDYNEKVCYYNIISYNEIRNYGNITLTGKFYNCALQGMGLGTINNYAGAVFTINSESKLSNDSGAVINNYGTFKFYGEFTGSGVFNNYDGGTTEQPVELLKDGVKSGSFINLADALTAANLSGSNYEIHVCTDITFNCAPIPPSNFPPIYPMVPNVTISGKKNDGSLSTLTFTGGNYNPSQYVILKDINIACSSGYSVFRGNDFGLQGEVHLPSATYSTVNVSGTNASTDTLNCTTLNLASGATFTTNNITASNITLSSSASLNSSIVNSSNSINLASGSKLKGNTVSVKGLTLNGGNITVNNNGLISINGAISGSGGTVILPLPSDHNSAISSMTFNSGSSVGSSTKITVQPADGITIPNNSKLILLKSSVAAARFGYSDPAQIFTQSSLDGLNYLTLRDAPYPSILSQEPVEPITYGESATLMVTATRISTSEQIPGTVKFYKGTTAIAANLIATVNMVNGSASCSLTSARLNSIGNNQFLEVYSDPENKYASSSVQCNINVNAKALSVTGANASSKYYDGKTDAQLNSITLSGIVGNENVTASAIATFIDSNVGVNKSVNLTGINLNGTAASHYTIPNIANDVPTTAAINKATPVLNLQAEPNADLAPGENVTITVNISGVSEGNKPNGSIRLKDGESIVGTAELTADSVQFTWNPATEGLHSLTAEYSGDGYYTTFSKSINLDLSKRMQAALTVTGVPASITYGDKGFSLQVTGGSCEGALTFSVASGSAVSVSNHGDISINSAGETIITVTKSGNVTYNEVSTTITIKVNKAVPTLSLPPEASSVYRTRTLAESVISSGRVGGAFGETLDGVFLWTDSGIPVPAEGSFDAVFVPQSINYQSLPLKITVGLKKAVPIISKVPSASKVDVGNKLSKSILSGGTAIGLDNILLTGTFTWDKPDKKVTGTAKYHAIFTPDNTEDYETVLFDILVSVNQQNYFITLEQNSGYINDSDIQINGTSVLVDLTDCTRVTPLQLAMLVEYNKEKTIILSGADYSFTFDKGALRPGIVTYDFGVVFHYGRSESSYIENFIGNKLVMSVDYNHSGSLPGKSRVRFYAGTRYVGKTLYYYLYNPENNRLEYKQPAVVNANGYIEVVQQHCSTYILTTQRLDTIVEIPETGINRQLFLSWLHGLIQKIFGCIF